jgi:hypothetical protein
MAAAALAGHCCHKLSQLLSAAAVSSCGGRVSVLGSRCATQCVLCVVLLGAVVLCHLRQQGGSSAQL